MRSVEIAGVDVIHTGGDCFTQHSNGAIRIAWRPEHTGASYEGIAARYAAAVDTKPWNADYERPALLSLLPSVTGAKVLDVGCGSGWYAEFLVGQGADVTAFDLNAEFVALTKGRVGTRARVLQADLTKPLSFAADRRGRPRSPGLPARNGRQEKGQFGERVGSRSLVRRAGRGDDEDAFGEGGGSIRSRRPAPGSRARPRHREAPARVRSGRRSGTRTR